MSVREVLPEEAARAFGEDVPFTASAGWLAAFPGRLSVRGVFDGGELQALWVMQTRRAYGARLVSDAPLAPHCGLTFRACAGNAEKRNSWRKRVMAALAEHLATTRWGVVSLTFPDWASDFQPFVWRGFKVVVRYTYQIALEGAAEDALLAEMSANRRNEIRNGHKKGLEVSLCPDFDVVGALVEKSLSRQGVAQAVPNARALLSAFATPENSYAYVTRREGRPVAACFCVRDRRRSYYVLGGVDDEHGVSAAAPMAVFASIRHAREAGLERFDFEGSMVPGIEQYFRSFGGALTPMYRVVKASLPIELALKPFKRTLF
jgi:hypothetical protein